MSARLTRSALLATPLAALVAAQLIFSLGCGGLMGDPTPEYDRSYWRVNEVPPAEFEKMDLPYHGGMVERSAEGFMEVSYRKELTVDQIVELWPAALEAEGWVQTSGGRTPNKGFSGTYTTPSGERASLSVRPTGTLWTVILTQTPQTP